jgi:hypothetical protein
MAVTITSQPGDVGLVKNKMIFAMTTDNYKDFDGQAGTCRLEIVTTPVEGDSFQVAWDDFNVDIQVKFGSLAEFNADTTNTVIYATPISSRQGAALAIKTRLEGNVMINANFTIDVVNIGSDWFVDFTQRAVGVETALETLSTEPWHEWIRTALSAGELYDGQFYVVSKLYVKNDAGDYVYLTEILTKPLSDQSLEVDVAEKLKAAVDDFILPTIGMTSELRQTSVVRDYQILFFEKKPSAAGSMQPVAAVEGKSAWFAGFTEEDFSAHPDPVTSWIAAGKKWLTWFPNDREVREDQEHFLSYINHDNSIGI